MSREEKRSPQDGEGKRPHPAVPQQLVEQIDHDRLPVGMSPSRPDLIPKKPLIPRYLWYFRVDIGRMGTWRHGWRIG
jgi:hypothetical protein